MTWPNRRAIVAFKLQKCSFSPSTTYKQYYSYRDVECPPRQVITLSSSFSGLPLLFIPIVLPPLPSPNTLEEPWFWPSFGLWPSGGHRVDLASCGATEFLNSQR